MDDLFVEADLPLGLFRPLFAAIVGQRRLLGVLFDLPFKSNILFSEALELHLQDVVLPLENLMIKCRGSLGFSLGSIMRRQHPWIVLRGGGYFPEGIR